MHVSWSVSVFPWNWRIGTIICFKNIFICCCLLGQERVRGLDRVYFKGSRGAFTVYDVTNGSTLDGALNWKHELDCQVMLKNGCPIPAVLLANKCDETKLCQRNASLLENICQEKGFIGWFQTSAKVTGFIMLVSIFRLHLESWVPFWSETLRQHHGVDYGEHVYQARQFYWLMAVYDIMSRVF